MNTIKFFHPEDTFLYHVEKCFCKVIYSGEHYQLLVEIHSTDDLEHVEGDSLQNDFPQVSLFVDDLPVRFEKVDQLSGETVEIPKCYEEFENEDGETESVYYTDVNFDEEGYEADNNKLKFFKDGEGHLCLQWKGEVEDFTEGSEESIPFELECRFSPPKSRED